MEGWLLRNAAFGGQPCLHRTRQGLPAPRAAHALPHSSTHLACAPACAAGSCCIFAWAADLFACAADTPCDASYAWYSPYTNVSNPRHLPHIKPSSMPPQCNIPASTLVRGFCRRRASWRAAGAAARPPARPSARAPRRAPSARCAAPRRPRWPRCRPACSRTRRYSRSRAPPPRSLRSPALRRLHRGEPCRPQNRSPPCLRSGPCLCSKERQRRRPARLRSRAAAQRGSGAARRRGAAGRRRRLARPRCREARRTRRRAARTCVQPCRAALRALSAGAWRSNGARATRGARTGLKWRWGCACRRSVPACTLQKVYRVPCNNVLAACLCAQACALTDVHVLAGPLSCAWKHLYAHRLCPTSCSTACGTSKHLLMACAGVC